MINQYIYVHTVAMVTDGPSRPTVVLHYCQLFTSFFDDLMITVKREYYESENS